MNFVLPEPNVKYILTKDTDIQALLTVRYDIGKATGNGFFPSNKYGRAGLLHIPAGTEFILTRLLVVPYYDENTPSIRLKIKTCRNSSLRSISFYLSRKDLQMLEVTPVP